MKYEPSQTPQIVTYLLSFIFIIAAAVCSSCILGLIAFFLFSSGTCMMLEYDDEVKDMVQKEEQLNAEAFAMLEARENS